VTNQLHPHQLRANAALHSLRAALDTLADRVIDEAQAIRAEQAARFEPLKSPTFGRRHVLGGHGDPTGDAVGTLGTTRPNRYDELEREVDQQLRDVARHLPKDGYFGSPVRLLLHAVPSMSPAAADATRVLADRIDGRIRRLLKLPHDRQLVPRVPCPACDSVGLSMRTSPPPDQRVVECTTCTAAWLWIEIVGSTAA
jgi:hypothetical protein